MKPMIYKYPVELEDTQLIKIPYGGVILDIQEQKKRFYMWVLFDARETYHGTLNMQNVRINIMATGKERPLELGYPGEHIATIQDHNNFVWHFFRGTP